MVFLFFGIIFFSGCSGIPVDPHDPVALLEEAERDIRVDHYQLALEKLRDIKNKFPYSQTLPLVQLRIADVYFLQDAFLESASAYESFRDLHPKHPKVAYAMFRIGKSYFRDFPSQIQRDLTSGHKALEAYYAFLKRFPEVYESEEARRDIGAIRKKLAEKDLAIADFYWRRNYFEAAQPRYQKILEIYAETESAKKAFLRLKAMETQKGG